MTQCQNGLAVVTECTETTSEHSRDNNDESDFGYLQNNFETTVSHQLIADFESHNSLASSMCTIKKQLKIENFSMPPKDKMQKIYELILQSDKSQSCNDLEYRVTNTVNSPITQSSHVIKSKSDMLKGMTTLAGLTKIDFGFPTFSIPITTIGYCFPQYHSVPSTSSSSIIPAINANINSCNTCNSELFKSDKTSQCFKGKAEAVIEHEAQTECKAFNDASYSDTQSKGHDVLQCLPKTKIIKLKSDIATGRIQENSKEAKELIGTEKSCVINNHAVDNLSKSPSSKMHDVEYTTSLDILVGLLNEIQKITTCQTQITKSTHNSSTNVDHLIELENILKTSSMVLKTPNKSLQKKISITAIEKLRQLDSKASFCSLYLTNNSDVDLMDKLHLKDNFAKPISVDKGVSVELLSQKEFTNTCTEVPSRFLPISVNHATDISNSLIGILSKPSTPSIITYGDHALHSNTSLTTLTKIIDLPQNVKKEVQIIEDAERSSKEPKKTFNYASTGGNRNKIATICTTKKLTANSTHYQIVEAEFDPIMKMKRDLLVTMYSVLVFTVFAALSIPEMLYRS